MLECAWSQCADRKPGPHLRDPVLRCGRATSVISEKSITAFSNTQNRAVLEESMHCT